MTKASDLLSLMRQIQKFRRQTTNRLLNQATIARDILMENPIRTHIHINHRLSGTPQEVGEGTSRVSLTTSPDMVVDDHELVHGGFIFGLADHAAMIAVNHPNVVLGSADVKFQKPVKVGETIIAVAIVGKSEGKKRSVRVSVKRGSETVFEGIFTCFILDRHVLEGS